MAATGIKIDFAAVAVCVTFAPWKVDPLQNTRETLCFRPRASLSQLQVKDVLTLIGVVISLEIEAPIVGVEEKSHHWARAIGL